MSQIERPDVRAFLAVLNKTPMAALEKLGPEGARLMTTQIRNSRPAVAHGLSVVRDLECPGPAGPIRLRFYDLCATRAPGPIVVYFHGGGFVLGDLDSHHQVCIEIATQVGVPVLSVDYRLAPENPFPAAPDDAEAATRWVASVGAACFGRAFTSLVLAGDSAGANLAAVTASALRPAATARANHGRVNAVIGELAMRYGKLADLHAHFLHGQPGWFAHTIEPSLIGASEVRRVLLEALS